MKFFSQLLGCCSRPHGTPAATAPPSKDDSHRAPLYSSADLRPLLKRSRPHWRPALSVIMEDRVGVAEDHDNNVDTKPNKKSSATWFSHDDHLVPMDRGKSMPIIMLSPFSMF